MSALKSQNIRLRLTSFFPRSLDAAVQKILEAVKLTGALVRGPIPLRTRRHQLTVLSSPAVDKDARDQFQICWHRRLIVIEEVTSSTMSAVKQLDLSPDVSIHTQIGER